MGIISCQLATGGHTLLFEASVSEGADVRLSKCTRCQQHGRSEETSGQAMGRCTVPEDHSPFEGLYIKLHCSVARRQDEVASRVPYPG